MPTPGSPTGIEAVYLANRDKLIRFLASRGAGDAAEDLVQDVWIKVSGNLDGPIANPLAYLFRVADSLMIDRYRARRRAERRDDAWMDVHGDGPTTATPPADRVVAARQEAARLDAALAAMGPRRETVFRRSRIEGVPQRRIAEELGVSLSTVETDLRLACRLLADLMERMR